MVNRIEKDQGKYRNTQRGRTSAEPPAKCQVLGQPTHGVPHTLHDVGYVELDLSVAT